MPRKRQDTNEQFDVAIIGAGPAGATAALHLAKRGRRVVLIDKATFPRKVTCAGWLNARCIPLLEELGVPVGRIAAHTFRDVTFYRADFEQSAKPVFPNAPGYLIDRAQFDNALVEAVTGGDATVIQGSAVTDVRLNESSAVLTLSEGRQVEGRLLILSAGRGTPLGMRVAVVAASSTPVLWTAQVDCSLKKGAAPSEPRVGVVLGLEKSSSFGLCCVSRQSASVGVNWFGEAEQAVPTLIQLCRRAFEHKVVPVNLVEEARRAKLLRSPASVALDMETHVGKHTLVIGDAGGFVSAASNEGIYPAMWSAKIAADVIDRALDSVHSQDALMSFDSEWRMQMAEYLRAPHTDIQFLLPLIFTNQPMADRMGAAFFSGENI